MSNKPLHFDILTAEDVDPRQLTALYLESRKAFRAACKRAERVSRKRGLRTAVQAASAMS